MHRAALITITAIALGLAAGGDDDTATDDARKPGSATVAAVEDVDRYCALGRELDADGEKFFSGLGKHASPAEFEAAERRFVDASQAKLDELWEVAPRPIKGDVATMLAAQRRRAGLKTQTEPDDAQTAAAEKRVLAFEKRGCRS